MAEPFSPEANARTVEKKIPSYSQTGILVSILDRANSSVNEYLGDTSLREDQKAIFSRLPENIVEELQAHLMSIYIEQRRYDPDRYINDFNQLKGEVFERLIEIEDELFDLFPDSTPLREEDDDRKRIGRTILALMQNPDRFNIDSFSISNPDLFDIRFENGTYFIETSIEAKTHLDGRTRHQLSDKGFKSAITKTIDTLNHLKDPQSHGLEGIGEDGHKIGISTDYQQALVVPRDLSLDADKIDRSLGTKYELSQEHAMFFSQKLIKMESRKMLRRSRFSQKEINELTRHFLNRINTKAEKETQEKLAQS